MIDALIILAIMIALTGMTFGNKHYKPAFEKLSIQLALPCIFVLIGEVIRRTEAIDSNTVVALFWSIAVLMLLKAFYRLCIELYQLHRQ